MQKVRFYFDEVLYKKYSINKKLIIHLTVSIKFYNEINNPIRTQTIHSNSFFVVFFTCVNKGLKDGKICYFSSWYV